MRVALCAVVAALLYLPALGGPALLEPDEGRYAEIAREMLISGDYVTPRDNWVRYFEKPPLVYWTTALAMRMLGANEFAARLPAAIFSIGQVAATEMIGEAMFGVTAGMLGAMALALSPLFFGFARFATLDPALAFFMTAALGLCYLAAVSRDLRAPRSRNLLLAAAVMLALGTLAKGPVALLLAGAIVFAFMLEERRMGELADLPWLAGGALYAAIVVPWFAAAAARNPGFLRFFFLHEHVARYLESSEHGWGPYFLPAVAAAGTWPWLAFAFPGAARLWCEYRAGDARGRARLAFLVLWFGIVLIFFSIPRSKLGSYILPGLPPIAILAGFGMARFVQRGGSRTFLACFAGMNLAIAAGLAAALIFAKRIGPSVTDDAAIIAGAMLAIALASVAAAYGARRAALAIVAAGVLAASIAGLQLRRDTAALYSYRRLAGVIAPAVQSGCVLASYRHFVQSLPFYTGRREVLVGYRGELAPFSDDPAAAPGFISDLAGLERLWRSPSCVVAIVNFHDLAQVSTALGTTYAMGCEGKKIALTNRPTPRPTPRFDCREADAEGGLGLRRRDH